MAGGFGNYDFHKVVWDASDANGNKVPQGIYFASVRNGKLNIYKKLIYMGR
ncbi:MAG: hypothetical protein HY769_01065 [Candidatus Stahlbacteria bacterium]|nr:hypothetical protein [Candidatus Stahlbacteria bacterium]